MSWRCARVWMHVLLTCAVTTVEHETSRSRNNVVLYAALYRLLPWLLFDVGRSGRSWTLLSPIVIVMSLRPKSYYDYLSHPEAHTAQRA